ncbi:PREDICTED: E3 ubiquitin-protein ligase RNF8-like isoform X1 [Papilio xuthus]|uniref:E3 ubiquitin-protein ligase CHFR n=1 Tax=Papilio xuthus TaxID=66420 RepID=A0AAJ7EKQ7_PAPXU|nr:PREDICTED: E3 ubiquitin-protein ligase RNF8-like isoform X1 [Papilio xuthus]
MQDNDVPFLISNKKLKPEYEDLERIKVSSTILTIGRGLKNSVVIPFLAISRNHCIVRKTYDEWFIEDHSSFGIEVNGLRLGNGKHKKLKNLDIITLDPAKEFVYSFIRPAQTNEDDNIECEPSNKRIKLENDVDSTDIINDVKIKFENSQSSEMQHIAEKIQNAQHIQKKSQLLKDHLQTEMKQKIQMLNKFFTTRIDSLEDGKTTIEEQRALLIQERDRQLAALKEEMEGKISSLKEEIEKHNAIESELILENVSLKQKLLKEREEFLSEINRESSSKQDLLSKLEAKMWEQEEIRKMEKRKLEEKLRNETEMLKLANEKEIKVLEEQKKLRESELLQALNVLKSKLESKEKETKQHKCEVEQELIKKVEQMKKVSEEEKIKMEELIRERGELHKKLAEAKLNANKSIVELKTRVEDRETELAALAAERIQKHSEQSTEVINSLLEQLDKVKSQLRSVENEKEMLKAENESGEISAKESAVAEFTDIMENELQCSICAELFVCATTLNCAHTFCKYCIAMWKKKKWECPICRKTITSECKSLVLDSFIEKMVENLSAEMKQKRLDLLKSREEEVTAMTSRTSTRRSTRGRRRSTRTSSNTDTTTSGRRHAASTRPQLHVAPIPIVDLTSTPLIPSRLPVPPPVIAGGSSVIVVRMDHDTLTQNEVPLRSAGTFRQPAGSAAEAEAAEPQPYVVS